MPLQEDILINWISLGQESTWKLWIIDEWSRISKIKLMHLLRYCPMFAGKWKCFMGTSRDGWNVQFSKKHYREKLPELPIEMSLVLKLTPFIWYLKQDSNLSVMLQKCSKGGLISESVSSCRFLKNMFQITILNLST